MLVSRIKITKINEAAQANSCRGLKGTPAKLKIKTERVGVGFHIPRGQNGELRAVKISGAVSPAARAIARVTPVIIAGIAAGITTCKTVW
jgi:hypothetical protein